MTIIQVAGITAALDNRHPDTAWLCRDYLSEETPVLTLRVTEEELAAERQCQSQPFSDGYLETVCLYRKLSLALLEYNVFLLHASVVAVDGEGFAFLAPSGTGKTTQTRLWLEHFGSRAQVVNGDKPLIRMQPTETGWQFIACGTPWQGKEDLGANTSVPLKALFFVEQSPVIQVTPAPEAEVVDRLFRQLLLPRDAGKMEQLLTMADNLVQTVPGYLLRCDQSVASVLPAYLAAKGETQ